MNFPLLASGALLAGLALGASRADAQLRLTAPELRLPPTPTIAGAPELLRFRAPWEIAAPRRAAVAVPDSVAARGPAAPGGCRMPVLGPIPGAARDPMPVFRTDTVGTQSPLRVAQPGACAPEAP